MNDPEAVITQFEVSCLPEGHPDRSAWSVKVEYCGKGLWSVIRGRSVCFDRDGNRTWVSALDGETREEWSARTRFGLETAMAVARKVAPELRINGYTVEDALAMGEEQP